MNEEELASTRARKIQPPKPRPKWIPEGGLTCLGPGCGKPIPAGWYGNRRKNYFCTEKCEKHYYLSLRPLVRCTWCREKFVRLHRGNNRPICSPECFKLWREEPLNKRIGRFKPLLDEFIADYCGQRTQTSRQQVRSNVGRFLAFMLATKIRSVNSVRYSQVSAFLKDLRSHGWRNTIAIVNTIKIFFDWTIATERRKLANPVIPRFHNQKVPKRLPRPYSKAEIELIWKILENSGDKALTAAVALAQESGARISEVANLRVQDIDLKKQEVFIRLPNKTNLEHSVPFHSKAKECLSSWLEARGRRDHDYVFVGLSGRPMRKETLRLRLKRLLCGERKLPTFSFHRLRSVAATTLAAGGSDVLSISRTIGWQDPKAAQMYIALNMDDLKVDYHDKMERRSREKAATPRITSIAEYFGKKQTQPDKSS